MSVSYATRQSLRSSLSLHRCLSSTAAPLPPSLPPAKLRALISIYHQSAHFITPQNLSDAIDQAFVGDPDDIQLNTNEMDGFELTKAFRRRENLIPTGRWNRVQKGLMSQHLSHGWVDGRIGREKQIIGALYGIDETGNPGLEVLLEERTRLIQNAKDDEE
jgi:hypothetical protein